MTDEDFTLPMPQKAFTIVLLGEGNLSYAHGLVKKLSKSKVFRRYQPQKLQRSDIAERQSPHIMQERYCQLFITTFDSSEELMVKYPETIPIREYFASKTRLRIHVQGRVNATSINKTLRVNEPGAVGDPAFQLIIFNNPHIGFEDCVRHRSLLSHFLFSAAECAAASKGDIAPQVVVALCDDQPRRWDLLGAARRSGLVCVAAVPLTSAEFPAYTPKRHQSDAAFPFQHMIQYFLMRREDCGEILNPLRHAWEHDSAWGANSRQVWDDSAMREADVGQSTTGASADVAVGRESDRFLHEVAAPLASFSPETFEELHFCIPPLHASLAFYSVGEVADSSMFCPYVPLHRLPSLYRLQLFLQDERLRGGGTEEERNAARIPSHLNPTLLGRPLTSKEQVKVQRLLAPSRRERSKSVKQDRSVVRQHYHCDLCESENRDFDTMEDLTQHVRAKHATQSLLHPNMYACGHLEVQQSTDAMADAGVPCDTCGLTFLDAGAYAKHLNYLNPQRGGGDASATCEECSPPRHFVDERAKQQHQLLKHAKG